MEMPKSNSRFFQKLVGVAKVTPILPSYVQDVSGHVPVTPPTSPTSTTNPLWVVPTIQDSSPSIASSHRPGIIQRAEYTSFQVVVPDSREKKVVNPPPKYYSYSIV